MILQEVGWDMDWSDLAQDTCRLWTAVDAVGRVRVSQNARNFLTNWGPVSFSGRTLLRGAS